LRRNIVFIDAFSPGNCKASPATVSYHQLRLARAAKREGTVRTTALLFILAGSAQAQLPNGTIA